MRSLFSRAKHEATGIAQSARIRIDVRNLEGRRDHLLREIGRRAYAQRDQTFRIVTEIEPLFGKVADVEAQIQSMKNEMNAARKQTAEASKTA
jgi:seryl-tRNA synthetase